MKKLPAVNREFVFALLLGFNLGITFMSIPPALQTLMGVYGVSYVTISVLIGTLFWSHALMQMPAGLITDRAGIKRTLVMSLFCVSFGAIFQLASRATSPDSMGGLVGFINFLANIGAVLFTLLFGWMKDASGSFGWSFAVLAFLCLIVAMGARIPERSRPSE